MFNTLAAITSKQAGFGSLGDAWADTTTSHGRPMLTVLGGLAQFERDLIRAPARDASGRRLEDLLRETQEGFRGRHPEVARGSAGIWARRR
ncbi:MAG: recombinase family protein [Stellaceae bacterium]